MVNRITQSFNGINFHRYPESDDRSTRFYYRGYIEGEFQKLHRYVYAYFFGKIPKGMHIDHIDGDRDNNDISNLQCLTREQHDLKHHDERSELMKKVWRSKFNNRKCNKGVK